jgi:serine/threonine protein kinase
MINYAVFEAKVMKQMKHPNLLGIDFVMLTPHDISLVVPFSDGGDLREFHRKVYKYDDGFDEEMVLFYAIQLISAVGYLQDRRIIHRDIKMANTLISKDGYLKLCDFGLAKKMEAGEKTNKFCGTTKTMAPEVIME